MPFYTHLRLYIIKLDCWENHPNTAASYNNLALVYKNEGEYKKAKELYLKSLNIRKRVLGENHPDTANSYNNLAEIYIKEGKYKKAEEFYLKSLNISERIFSSIHRSKFFSGFHLVYADFIFS